MELDGFLEKFRSTLQQTPIGNISPLTNFKKLDEWSSIFALIVIAMVDAEYGKVLTANDIHPANTLEDLFEIIQSK